MAPRVDDFPASGISRVAVIGATGRLGRRAVRQLLDRGVHCKLLLRQAADADEAAEAAAPDSLESCASAAEVGAYFRSLPREQVTIVEGGCNGVSGNLPALVALVEDCDACLALWGSTRRTSPRDFFQSRDALEAQPLHAKQVNYRGVLDLIRACRRTGGRCKRIVRVTGKGEDPEGFFSILINLLGSMATAWNYEGEQALRAQTAVEYTIVRPGIMVEDAGRVPKDPQGERLLPRERLLQLADDGASLPVTTIRYEDVASLCVEVLDYANAAGCTLTALDATAAREASSADWQSSWGPLLKEVQPDRRYFPSDMLDRHYAAVDTTKRRIAGLGIILIVIILLCFLLKSLGV